MIRLFTESDFDLLKSWVTSHELLFQFSANTFPFPLVYTDMLAYKIAHPERKFYIAHDNAVGYYGFGEIIPQEGGVPRLGRLLIGPPELRGKGLGKKLISLLLQECYINYNVNRVELFVLNDNKAAIKCYLNFGFEYTGDEFEIDFNGNKKIMKKMGIGFYGSLFNNCELF